MPKQYDSRDHGRGTGYRVVVLGAGYAGLMAALRCAPHHRVTLVDPGDRFTERIRLHELAAGRPAAEHPLSGLLGGTGVSHVVSRAAAIDTERRTVRTDDGRTLPYDRLVHALGSRTDTRGGALGTGERAYTAEAAPELHKRLLDRPGSLAVVGGGLTGIELATELAEAHPAWSVRLVTSGEPGPGLSAKGRAHVRTVLAARGVRIETGRQVATADDVDADAVVWAGSMAPRTELAERAGIALDPASGRVRVDESLRSVSHPEVYAVGDSAAASTPTAGGLRMCCAAAFPTGAHAAASITAEARGRTPDPLRFSFNGQCVSLGRNDGLIQLVHPDDSPRDRVLTGRPAAYVKEQVVRSTMRFLRLAAHRPWAVRALPGIS